MRLFLWFSNTVKLFEFFALKFNIRNQLASFLARRFRQKNIRSIWKFKLIWKVQKKIFVSFKLCYLEVQSRKTPKCIVHMKQRNDVKLYPVQNLNIHIFTQCKLVNSDKPVLLSKPCVLWIGRVFANLAPHKSKLSAI